MIFFLIIYLGSDIRDLRTGHDICDIPCLANYVKWIENVWNNAQIIVTLIAINSVASFTADERWKVGNEFISQELVGPVTNTLRKFCIDVRCPDVVRVISDFFAIVSLDRNSPSVFVRENTIPALTEALREYSVFTDVCVSILRVFDNLTACTDDLTEMLSNEGLKDIFIAVIEQNFSSCEIIIHASQIIEHLMRKQDKTKVFIDESLIKHFIKALRIYVDDYDVTNAVCSMLINFSFSNEGEGLLVSMGIIQIFMKLLKNNIDNKIFVGNLLRPLANTVCTPEGVSLAIKEGIVDVLLKVIGYCTPIDAFTAINAFKCYKFMLVKGIQKYLFTFIHILFIYIHKFIFIHILFIYIFIFRFNPNNSCHPFAWWG